MYIECQYLTHWLRYPTLLLPMVMYRDMITNILDKVPLTFLRIKLLRIFKDTRTFDP